jgi:hypothetical protein
MPTRLHAFINARAPTIKRRKILVCFSIANNVYNLIIGRRVRRPSAIQKAQAYAHTHATL